jgi:hypothetical protein
MAKTADDHEHEHEQHRGGKSVEIPLRWEGDRDGRELQWHDGTSWRTVPTGAHGAEESADAPAAGSQQQQPKADTTGAVGDHANRSEVTGPHR